MPYSKTLVGVFNPIYIISLQSLLAAILLYSRSYFDIGYYFIVLSPMLAYLPLSVSLTLLYAGKIRSDIFISELIYKVTIILILIVSAFNVLLVYNLVESYGGIESAIANAGETYYIVRIQFNPPRIVSALISFNYIMPVLVVIVAIKNKILSNLTVLLFPVILLLIVGVLFGARILVIDVIVSYAVAKSMKMGLNYKSVSTLIVSGVLAVLCLSAFQAYRERESLDYGLRIVGDYYARSVQNGSQVFESNARSSPMYWSLRPLLSVPYASDIIGVRDLYEELFGKIPISSREDDFKYAEAIGVDPNFNTFSMYGYSILDAGSMGVFIILFAYFLLQIVYFGLLSGNFLCVLLFPPLYALAIDQLRTNGIFSPRVVFFILIALILAAIKFVESNRGNRAKYHALRNSHG